MQFWGHGHADIKPAERPRDFVPRAGGPQCVIRTLDRGRTSVQSDLHGAVLGSHPLDHEAGRCDDHPPRCLREGQRPR